MAGPAVIMALKVPPDTAPGTGAMARSVVVVGGTDVLVVVGGAEVVVGGAEVVVVGGGWDVVAVVVVVVVVPPEQPLKIIELIIKTEIITKNSFFNVLFLL